MRILVAFLTLTLLLITVEAESDPGVTDTSVKIGMITDLTGPLAFIGQELSAGTRLYLQYINDQGGVHGRRIDLIVEDDGYMPPRTVAAFRKLVDRDRVFCFTGNMGSATTMATLPLVKREKIPLIAPANYNSVMHDPPKRYIFAIDPTYPLQSWIIVKYIMEIEKAEQARLSTIYQDDDYGRDGLKGLRKAAKHYGLPIVAEEPYKRGAVDFSTQVLNLKQAEPTHVILWTTTREAAAIMTKARQLDWQPQFIGGAPTGDLKVIELAGEAARGFMAISGLDLDADPPNAQMQHYFDVIKQYTPEKKPRTFHAGGFMIGQLMVEGLKRAGRDLTREGLVEAMETINNWSDHVGGAPFTYGPDIRGGTYTTAFLVRADVEKKILTRATDWIEYRKPAEMVQDE